MMHKYRLWLPVLFLLVGCQTIAPTPTAQPKILGIQEKSPQETDIQYGTGTLFVTEQADADISQPGKQPGISIHLTISMPESLPATDVAFTVQGKTEEVTVYPNREMHFIGLNKEEFKGATIYAEGYLCTTKDWDFSCPHLLIK